MSPLKVDLDGADALKEAFSIGIGHASGALSQMTGQGVDINAIDLRVMPLENVTRLFDEPERDSVGMVLDITDGLKGSLLLLSSADDSLMISDIILKKGLGGDARFGSISTDALREMGNILAGAYLTSLSTFTGLNLVESIPRFIFDKAEKISEFVCEGYKGKVKYFFALDTELLVSRNKFKQKMVLVLDNDSFDKLFNAMVDNNLK